MYNNSMLSLRLIETFIMFVISHSTPLFFFFLIYLKIQDDALPQTQFFASDKHGVYWKKLKSFEGGIRVRF